MSKRLRTGALLAVGYGLARAVTANSYITAFGAEAGTSLGLVAQTSFSVATNLVSAAVALAMVALVLRGFARGGFAVGGRATRGSGDGCPADARVPGGLRLGRSAAGVLCAPGCGAAGPHPCAAGRIPFSVLAGSCAVLVAGYAAGALGLFSSLGVGTGALTCGIVYAVGSVALTLAWFEPFALEPDTGVAVRGLVCGFLVQAAGFFALSWLAGWWLFAATLLMLAVSCAVRWALLRLERGGRPRECAGLQGCAAAPVCRCAADAAGSSSASGTALGTDSPAGPRAASPAGSSPAVPFGAGSLAGSPVPGGYAEVVGLFRSALGSLFGSLLCVFMLTAVVGLLHSSVIGGAFEPVVGAVPMSESLVLAAVLLAAVVFVSRRVPTTASVYRVLFPLMLIALSVLPFVPYAFGHYAGMVMVVCYNLVGMAFVLFLVETAHASAVPQVALMGVYQAGTQLFTVVGLALGIFLNTLEARAEASYATILILVCIYLLAMVPVVLSRRSDRARGGRCEGGVPAMGGRSAAGQPADGAARSAAGPVSPTDPSATPAAALAEADFARQQEVRGRVGARVEEWALARGLTAREAQVLVQLARGRSANAIAADLGIAANTAWAHIKRIYVKLDVHSKQELIEYIEREVIDRQG